MPYIARPHHFNQALVHEDQWEPVSSSIHYFVQNPGLEILAKQHLLLMFYPPYKIKIGISVMLLEFL